MKMVVSLPDEVNANKPTTKRMYEIKRFMLQALRHNHFQQFVGSKQLLLTSLHILQRELAFVDFVLTSQGYKRNLLLVGIRHLLLHLRRIGEEFRTHTCCTQFSYHRQAIGSFLIAKVNEKYRRAVDGIRRIGIQLIEDVEDAASAITQQAHPDANIIWGVAFDPDLDDQMIITVVATGFASDRAGASAAVESFMNQIQQASQNAPAASSAHRAAPTVSAAPAAPAAPAAAPENAYAVPTFTAPQAAAPQQTAPQPTAAPQPVTRPASAKSTPSTDIDDDDFYVYLKDIIKNKNEH